MLNGYINKLNGIQRAGVFLWGVSVLTMLILHNPTSGYYDFTYNLDKDGTFTLANLMTFRADRYSFVLNERDRLAKECIQTISQLTSQLTIEDIVYIEKSKAAHEIKRLGCYETHIHPVSEWKSMEPILPWFGRLVNLGWSLFLSLIFVLFFLYMFKDRKQA